MIWYSSSIPIVKEGDFISLPRYVSGGTPDIAEAPAHRPCNPEAAPRRG
jgi:hypothetical protein